MYSILVLALSIGSPIIIYAIIRPIQKTVDLSSTYLLVKTYSGDRYFKSCNYAKSSWARFF